MEIFSRLPVKSVGRCRCLSKLWNKVICGQYFIDLFAENSSARPQILFVQRVRNESPGISFFSSHQPYENTSSYDDDDDKIALTHRTHYPISFLGCDFGVPINGLVCLNILTEFVDKIRVVGIYNPHTGEFLTLPKVNTRQKYNPDIKFFLVYDPTENQFKVLSLVYRDFSEWLPEHRVLTLKYKEELSWRMIECCCKPHIPRDGIEICIHGVLYYLASRILNEEHLMIVRFDLWFLNKEEFIVCFDVRSETFRFMKTMETPNQNLPSTTIFTKYNGKLALLVPGDANHWIIGQSTSFELWVLTEKHEWCKHRYVLPPAWKNVVGTTIWLFNFVGMIGTKVIVYRSRQGVGPPYILCYNIEKNTIRKLTIQGIEPLTPNNVVVFLDHVDSLSLTRTLRL